MTKRVPNQIETERLIIRCLMPDDVDMVQSAISKSLDNLRKWVNWAKYEPSSRDSKMALLKEYQSKFSNNIDYNFGLFNKEQDAMVGAAGLHTRIGEDKREIGYWINSEFLNQGYATEAVQALIRVGFEYHQVNEIQIQCDPNNVASQLIPKRLGFKHLETIKENRERPDGGMRDTMIWSLDQRSFDQMVHEFPEIQVSFVDH